MKWLLISAIFATCERSKRAILLPPTPATLCKGGFSHVLWGSQSAHALLQGAPGWGNLQIPSTDCSARQHEEARLKQGAVYGLLVGFLSLFSQAGESLLCARSRKAMRHRGMDRCA